MSSENGGNLAVEGATGGTTDRAAAAAPVEHGKTKNLPAIYAMIGPFFVLFALLTLAPVVYAVYKSFFSVERTGGVFGSTVEVFSWFKQYGNVLSDGTFLTSVGRVIGLGLVQVPVMLIAALGLALLLDSVTIRFRRTFRLVYFLPYGIPGVAAIVMWAALYSPERSPVGLALHAIGIDVNFLSPGTVLWSVANILTFSFTGYNMLIIYSALQGISGDLYEAARLDGANAWSIAMKIKVPIVAPAIVLTAVFSIIGTMQLFTEPYVMRGITPSIDANYTPTMIIFANSTTNYGYAAAAAVLLALGSFVLSFGFLKLTEGRVSE